MKSRLLLPLVLAACAQEDPGQEPSTPERPDVVLIVVDTLRADRLGCYGYERPTSPVIDRLAAQGTLFLEARAQCSWTLPSMAIEVAMPELWRVVEDPDVRSFAAINLGHTERRVKKTLGIA